MKKTKLIIAVGATLLMSSVMCSSSDNNKDDFIPIVVRLTNNSKDRPKEKMALYLNEVEVFEGEVLYVGDRPAIKRLDLKIKKGSRCFLRVISEGSKIKSEVVFDVKQTMYVWVGYNYDQDKKIPSFTFALNDYDGGWD